MSLTHCLTSYFLWSNISHLRAVKISVAKQVLKSFRWHPAPPSRPIAPPDLHTSTVYSTTGGGRPPRPQPLPFCLPVPPGVTWWRRAASRHWLAAWSFTPIGCRRSGEAVCGEAVFRKTGGNFPVEPVRPDARTGAVLTSNYGSIFEISMNPPVWPVYLLVFFTVGTGDPTVLGWREPNVSLGPVLVPISRVT
jgi:hypothetical protein